MEVTMPTITSLKAASRRPGFVRIDVDDTTIGFLSEADVVELGIHELSWVDEGDVAELEARMGRAEALRVANRFIAHRPRSTEEVRQRLRRDRLDDGAITAAIETLVAQGVLDDKRFADQWVDNRIAFSPRSSRLLQAELRRKGVDRGTIEETLEAAPEADDTALALDAGRRRLHHYRALDRDVFNRSLSAYLARRGFGYDSIRHATVALWSELHEG
jgi:regulatory protein